MTRRVASGTIFGVDDREGQEAGLRRVVTTPGAVLLGLGAIVGTGVFVGVGIAAGVAGPSVVTAAALAACVAACNGLSSAQLAARHPVSGGTYEYGYRELHPVAGFTAGWTFLIAKSASAATAALGFAGYALAATGGDEAWRVPLALAGVALLTCVVAGGVARSSRVNAVIVSLTLGVLALFVVTVSSTDAVAVDAAAFVVPPGGDVSALLRATALMFVGYTGYGRIATLGEEVRTPRVTIPRAILVTLVASALLYVAVAVVAVRAAGAEGLARMTSATAAPLELVAREAGLPTVAWCVGLGAVTAMLGVSLNLLLGLSRVVLAMARRGDFPARLARVDARRSSPTASVLVVGLVVAALTCLGDVETTWSSSAFAVLVYYAITNAAALRLPAEARLYPRWISWAGLLACLGLAPWIDARIAAWGVAWIVVGLAWHAVAARRRT